MAFSNIIESDLDYHDKTLIENIEYSKKELEDLLQIEKHIELGGGVKNIEKQHKKGRLTARERIQLLVDQDTQFFELAKLAAYGLYKEYGGAPSAGTITGLGYIEGRLTMIIANDATVKAGAFFPMTPKKSYVLNILPWNSKFRRFISSIAPVFFFRYRMKSFRIKMISAASFEIMR